MTSNDFPFRGCATGAGAIACYKPDYYQVAFSASIDENDWPVAATEFC